MKRMIRASQTEKFTNADLKKILKDADLWEELQDYELKAQRYERYSNGAVYTKKFMCPGDWLAFLSMLVHNEPNARTLQEEDIQDLIEECPTVEDMEQHASKNWWGDGDDYIIYLKNLNTNEYLYGPEEESFDEDEDEDDGEGWEEYAFNEEGEV